MDPAEMTVAQLRSERWESKSVNELKAFLVRAYPDELPPANLKKPEYVRMVREYVERREARTPVERPLSGPPSSERRALPSASVARVLPMAASALLTPASAAASSTKAAAAAPSTGASTPLSEFARAAVARMQAGASSAATSAAATPGKSASGSGARARSKSRGDAAAASAAAAAAAAAAGMAAAAQDVGAFTSGDSRAAGARARGPRVSTTRGSTARASARAARTTSAEEAPRTPVTASASGVFVTPLAHASPARGVDPPWTRPSATPASPLRFDGAGGGSGYTSPVIIADHAPALGSSRRAAAANRSTLALAIVGALVAVVLAMQVLAPLRTAVPDNFCDSGTSPSPGNACTPCPESGSCYQGQLECNAPLVRAQGRCVTSTDVVIAQQRFMRQIESILLTQAGVHACYPSVSDEIEEHSLKQLVFENEHALSSAEFEAAWSGAVGELHEAARASLYGVRVNQFVAADQKPSFSYSSSVESPPLWNRPLACVLNAHKWELIVLAVVVIGAAVAFIRVQASQARTRLVKLGVDEGHKFIESRRDAAERSEVGAAGHVGVPEEDLASHIADVLMQANSAGLTRADINRIVHHDVCPALMARTDISLKQLMTGTFWDVSR